MGASAYALPVLISAMLIHKALKDTLKPHKTIYVCSFFALVCLSLLFTISASEGVADYLGSTGFFHTLTLLIEGGTTCSDGGITGALGIPLKAFFGALGSQIIIIFTIIILIAKATKFIPVIWAVKVTRGMLDMMNEKFSRTEEEYEDDAIIDEAPVPKEEKKEKFEQTKLDLDAKESADLRHRVKKALPEKKKEEKEEESFALPAFNIANNSAKEEKADDIKINITLPPQEPQEEFPLNEYTPVTPAEEKEEKPVSLSEKESSPSVMEKKEPNVAIELTEDDFIAPVKPYEFPPIDLLARNTDRGDSGKGVDLREQARRLVETLKSFGVDAKVLEVSKGPTVTRFELQPATGVKVSKIVNLADDIALNLAALSVRIEAPIPGKAAVGIEIPNTGNTMVRLREVIDSDEFKNFKAKTAFALGKDISGKPIVTDISKMPHVLIAGTTGSGKSVCINSLITSIIYKADPNEVKFIMIDPKVVELKVYNGIPHLLIPVVTDARKAAGALNWAVQEMTKRYKMFADNNVRDLKGYNELAELQGERKLEQIIIIVDELADLMMVAPRDVEDAICRLAQMARAAGMHLVIATQSPRADIITGLIKTNIPSRIAFAVQSQLDSRIIMDIGGAEKLLGKGDMLFLPMGASKPTRIQGAFISDGEVEKIIEFVKQDDIRYDEDVMEKIENGTAAEKEESSGDADEFLPKAIEIVVEAGQASASLLQRRLSVGYSRAGRLIDQLEARGIIGPHEGAKPRQVLISRAEYAEMMMQSTDNN
ncbi:MAG: DNA translocase FtsK [Clostridia bacterium]|nr:DNA translocase FtsK [Clostridia bacterium]